MHIAVSGSSGLLGSALVPALRARGHDVARLVRRPAQSADEISWDPMQGTVDMARFAETACVVHLAGVGVGDHRWTESYKAEILRSRVDGTATISRALAAIGGSTSLVCGSAIGFYGDTGDRAVDESAPVGRGFLADVVRQWEDSAQPAIDAGVRTCFARTGLVVSAQGGAWARLFPIFRAGLGGRIGSGRQYMSFISLRDEINALVLLAESSIVGPVNLTAPRPVTNSEVTEAMGRILGRPTLLPVPAFALRTALGEFADDILGSQRILPGVLTGAGFAWQDPDIDSAVRAALD